MPLSLSLEILSPATKNMPQPNRCSFISKYFELSLHTAILIEIIHGLSNIPSFCLFQFQQLKYSFMLVRMRFKRLNDWEDVAHFLVENDNLK